MTETPGWQQQLAHLQTRLDVLAQQQIQAWHLDRERLLQRAAMRFGNVGVDITHVWQGVGQPLQEVRTQKDLEGITTDFRQAVEMTKDDREWRDVEQTPEHQAGSETCPSTSPMLTSWDGKPSSASMRSKTPPASGTGRICITERPVPT